MKYLFFDIDGVLNKSSEWKKMYSLNQSCIDVFCTLIREFGLTPIMTSSWRKGFVGVKSIQNTPNVAELEKEFSKRGIEIAGKTPILMGHARDYEIERYLFYHPCDSYIILDDDPEEFKKTDSEHFYFVKSENGLRKEDLKKIKKMLKRMR